MPDQWEFMSHTYDNCNCSVSCGCQFNEPTTHGNCQFAYIGTVIAEVRRSFLHDSQYLLAVKQSYRPGLSCRSEGWLVVPS